MALPLFYEENMPGSGSFILSEETSRHVIQVLRKQKDDQLSLTNGKGQTHLTQIIQPNKKSTTVNILSTSFTPPPSPRISIALSLIKNKVRFEWFLEKATEIGVQQIIPMICERTEKETFRLERMNNILISAMLQSNQSWLPQLSPPVYYSDILKSSNHPNKFIAHCLENEKKNLGEIMRSGDRIILIGPEGDFTQQEIDLAVQSNFTPVTLGHTRLRTETAGLVACVLLN